MEKLNFKTQINAPADKVWESLWNEDTYSQWTNAFDEGSKLNRANWEEGSHVHFTAANGHGMYSEIVKKTENKYVAFKHLGEVKDGQEMPIDEKAKEWSGAMEIYTLTESDGKTEVLVEVEMQPAELDFINKAFPKALEALKRIAES